MVVFFDDFIRFIIVLKQELIEALELVLDKQIDKKNFNKSTA